jgi:hypothetical protein
MKYLSLIFFVLLFSITQAQLIGPINFKKILPENIDTNYLNKPFFPWIIASDLLTPFNLKIEKIVKAHISFSIRVHDLWLRLPSNKGNFSRSSVTLDAKWFNDKVQPAKYNYFFGIYGKWRYSSYDKPPRANNSNITNYSNFFVGGTIGMKYIRNHFNLESYAGLGISPLLRLDEQLLIPFDVRLNLSLGYAIY